MVKSQGIAILTIIALVALYTHHSSEKEYSFEQFKADYQKSYTREGEQQYRKVIFLKNLAKIAEHNSNSASTYQMGVNQFTDLTDGEFQAIYLTMIIPENAIKAVVEDKITQTGVNIDWTAAGKVSLVKNQGACGSCWAFSAIAGLESAGLLNNDNTLYSEQDLVDCSKSYGNNGCNGGWTDNAYKYIKDKGIATSDAYPYVAKDQTCNNSVSRSKKISSFTDVPGCDNLINALAGRPISVGVDASNWSPYKSGIFSNCATSINHGVLLAGATDDYWKVKNSWGPAWGQSGYIRLARGNTCAICNYPSYPTL